MWLRAERGCRSDAQQHDRKTLRPKLSSSSKTELNGIVNRKVGKPARASLARRHKGGRASAGQPACERCAAVILMAVRIVCHRQIRRRGCDGAKPDFCSGADPVSRAR